MTSEDVLTIEGSGTVTTGRVERGKLKRNDDVEIVGIHPQSTKTVATAIEMFHKDMDESQAGDNVGVLLRGIKREDVVRGQVLAKPGSIKPHTQFKAQVYVLSKEEGGRHTPFLTGYRPPCQRAYCRPHPTPNRDRKADRDPQSLHRQRLARAIRDAHAQARRRHPRLQSARR